MPGLWFFFKARWALRKQLRGLKVRRFNGELTIRGVTLHQVGSPKSVHRALGSSDGCVGPQYTGYPSGIVTSYYSEDYDGQSVTDATYALVVDQIGRAGFMRHYGVADTELVSCVYIAAGCDIRRLALLLGKYSRAGHINFDRYRRPAEMLSA